jgi:hypothetical protein
MLYQLVAPSFPNHKTGSEMTTRAAILETIVLVSVIIISGCATLVSYKDGDSATLDSDKKSIKPGLVPYYLPFTDILVTTTYNITNCENGAGGVQISASAAIDTETGSDPDGVYYIDSVAFQEFRFLKTSDLKIDRYPNGTLSTVNGHLSDQTGQILASGLSAAVGIMGAIGRLALVNNSPCTDAVFIALKKLHDAQASLTAKQAPPAAAQAELQSEIAALTRQLTIVAQQRLSLKPKDFQDNKSYSSPIESTPISVWFRPGSNPSYGIGPDPSKLQIIVSLHGGYQISKTNLPDSSPDHQGHPIEGIVYRAAAPVDIDVCFGTCDIGNSIRDASNKAAEKNVVMISQLGTPLISPLKNGLFQDSDMTISQDQSGNVSDIEFKNTSTMSTILSSIGQIFTTQQTQENAALTANAALLTAKSNSLNAQTTASTTNAALPDTILSKQADCLTQQAAIIKAGGTPKVPCQ